MNSINTNKIAQADVYAYNEKAANGTLEYNEWNDISTAVATSHAKINSLIDDVANLPTGSTTPATIGTDYSYTYTAGLLLITIKPDGALADEDKIEIYYDALMPGYVHLYALMDDGTIADSVIKQSILDACNADTVRPLTDCVEVKDAEYVDYNINFTYFVDRKSEKPLTDIQTAVVMAVNDFIDWQSAKIGRDINPSKLEWLLKDTGVKRVVITSPTFTSLRGGDDHAKPQVARCTAQTIVNGGYEDE